MNRVLSWLASFFLESPQEREHRVRQEQALAARDRLRRNISWLKTQRLNEVRAELDVLGEAAIADYEEGAFLCDPPEEKSA